MSLESIRARTAASLLAFVTAAVMILHPLGMWGQAELTRKTKTKVTPVYPELARRTNITGTVKVFVVVLPDGALKEAKVLGGNPVLVGAAMDALRKWKFEPADSESSGTVEFKFQP